MTKSLLFVIPLAALATSAVAKDKVYTLADLKTLVAQKAYKEAFTHLGDVAPADRNTDWLDVAATAAGGALATLPYEDCVPIINVIEFEYPQLLKSPKYMKQRNDIGMAAYTKCFANVNAVDWCLEPAAKFVDNGDVEIALKIGRLARKHAYEPKAGTFFKRAVAKNPAVACKDPDLAATVLSNLGMSEDRSEAADARSIAGACWDQLKKPILDAFEKDQHGYVRGNTCKFHKDKKVLSAAQSRQCK